MEFSNQVGNIGEAIPEPEENEEVLAVIESEEFGGYLEELRQRLPAYGLRAASVMPEEPGSIELAGRIGKFWWEARERAGVSRYQIAERMGMSPNQVRFLEVGLASPEELRNGILPAYAEALGQPELLEECRQQFHMA